MREIKGVSVRITCPDCNGTGKKTPAILRMWICRNCDGDGYIPAVLSLQELAKALEAAK